MSRVKLFEINATPADTLSGQLFFHFTHDLNSPCPRPSVKLSCIRVSCTKMTRALPSASCRVHVELFVENATPADTLLRTRRSRRRGGGHQAVGAVRFCKWTDRWQGVPDPEVDLAAKFSELPSTHGPPHYKLQL